MRLNQKGITPIYMVIGALLIVVAGAYWFGKTSTQPPNPIIPTISQPSPTPDKTANWKTYTNTKYGYLIKYTSDWATLHREPDTPLSEAKNDSEIVGIYKVGFLSSDNYPLYQITIEPRPYTKQLFEGAIQSSRGYDFRGSPNKTGFLESTKIINGIEMTIIERKKEGGPKKFYLSKDYLFKTPDNKYYITVSTADTVEQDDRKTIDLILTTFKFTQ